MKSRIDVVEFSPTGINLNYTTLCGTIKRMKYKKLEEADKCE